MTIKCKKILLFSALAVFSAMCIMVSGALSAREQVAQKIVRLHILANSNSAADQALKISVRDRLLSESRHLFAAADTADECQKILNKNISYLEAAANDEIRKNGFAYPVKITQGNYYFPMKSYSSYALPAGNYNAVRVNIGDATGDNWWCVMFPPLCFVGGSAGDAALSDVLTADQLEFVSAEGGVTVKFKIADFFEQSVNSVKTALKK